MEAHITNLIMQSSVSKVHLIRDTLNCANELGVLFKRSIKLRNLNFAFAHWSTK